MRYLTSLTVLLALTSGCVLVFDDGGDDVCILAGQEAAAVPAPQRNPETLTCESFGGGICDPSCGPCPAIALAPAVSWGFCGSTCEALGETDCAKSPECRVVKDAACAVSGSCTTDFVGCFPTDQIQNPTLDCFTARDGFSCSQNPACTAYHRSMPNALDAQRAFPFAMCTPEGKSPGKCHAEVTCERVAPACPASAMPGVDGGCYTGACIPTDLCEPAPQQ